MKREIKFRAWNRPEKRMEHDMFYIHQATGGCFYLNDNDITGEPLYDCGEEEPILMQFTGLLDRNGKEIYEGDILSKVYGSSVPRCAVAWHNERAMFIQHDGYNEALFELNMDYIEVIGNIYENPELLFK